MAGRGPAPKAFEQRRNHHEPLRGEWIDLAPLQKSQLPSLPKDEWSERTKRAWKAWSQDPATGQYGPAELQSAVDLAYVYEEWVRKGGSSIAGEIRQRLDGLGLSPKGKQERRWRVTVAESVEVEAEVTELRPLRSVS
jgi:hypothetical protein